jgi:hypothetical protein
MQFLPLVKRKKEEEKKNTQLISWLLNQITKPQSVNMQLQAYCNSQCLFQNIYHTLSYFLLKTKLKSFTQPKSRTINSASAYFGKVSYPSLEMKPTHNSLASKACYL